MSERLGTRTQMGAYAKKATAATAATARKELVNLEAPPVYTSGVGYGLLELPLGDGYTGTPETVGYGVSEHGVV